MPHALLLELLTERGVGTMLTQAVQPDERGAAATGTLAARAQGRAHGHVPAPAARAAQRQRRRGSRPTTAASYLDLVGGIAVNLLGHNHPALQPAIAAQAATLIHTSNLYYTEPQLELAELLIASAFPSRVFFCNSGAEANEGAIKLARKWGKLHRDGADVIVCAQGAFHGRTLGALAATANRALPRAVRAAAARDSCTCRTTTSSALEPAIDSTTCAVMLEPIEGESGVVPLEPGRLAAIRRLCDERDVLLILDEVQTGMGRTGRWWAHQHEDAAPDVMTVAKGLGGGFPIGAILAAPRADVFEPGDHGSTFGGGPLACAAAVAVMRTVERDGSRPARRRGRRLPRRVAERACRARRADRGCSRSRAHARRRAERATSPAMSQRLRSTRA